jgi:hypothetical protein
VTGDDSERLPLTPAQRQTAAELPWYRAWLLRTGRQASELDEPTEQES